MEETVRWLRGRPYHEGQIRAHEPLEGHTASFGECTLGDRLETALREEGIERLYDHQAQAIEGVRAGRNVVLATPTASGKSLAYTVPAFERALDRRATTLYVAPQVALIEDQAETLSALADRLGFASGVTVERYTGRQDREEKAAIRERQPTVLLTTPDMLHYGVLPHAHRLWDWFVERLETVVIDEGHEYRGVFGAGVSLVMRRLARVAERFGADPEYVCCSATVGNPVEHAATVTGRSPESFDLVSEDTSATGPTHWLLWNPPEYDGGGNRTGNGATNGAGAVAESGSGGWGDGRRRSSHTETRRLFVDLVERGLQTLVFTGARQTAERYASGSAKRLRERGEHDAARSVNAYHAALTDDRRREVEAGLRSGEIRGTWSTSALELGVDIGGLDAVLLDGYPGTRMSSFQRAGRAGRGTDPALVVLVAGEDQLDQYLMRNPRAFFDGDPERAVTDPGNDELLPDHVRCAARENWLRRGDEGWFGEGFPDLLAHLESTGDLRRRETPDGTRWTTDGSPHHSMSLRSIDDHTVQLKDTRRDEVVATLPFEDAMRDAHRGAVYHHQGRKYEVRELDLDHGVAELEPTWADYYTRTLHEKAIAVERDITEKPLEAREDVPVRFAEVTMRKRITGFRRMDANTGRPIGEEDLDLPETELRTRALYVTVPEDVERSMRAGPGSFDGGIHAAEHATIAMLPDRVLCDRRDVGGLSAPMHPHTGRPTVFVYDGYPGGVGLTREAYADVDDLLRTTVEMLRGCPCETGCPACVQSPHCGNANDPLDKRLAAELLGRLTDR